MRPSDMEDPNTDSNTQVEETKVKHAGGRPLEFKTVEELQAKIDEYFEWCDNRIKTIFDEKTNKELVINYPAPYTMSGLARRLGIDRKTLVNYSHRDEFFPAIRAARERVHEDVETRLMDTRNEKGAIFNLKNNFGWKDESVNKTDLTSKGKPLSLLSSLNVPSNNSAEETQGTEQEN